MRSNTAHPSRLTLRMAVDRELTVEAEAQLRRHLGVCGACREEMEQCSAAALALKQRARDAAAGSEDLSALRIRLRAGMADTMTAIERSWLRRQQEQLARIPLALRSVAALAALMVGLWIHAGAFAPEADATKSGALPIAAFTPGAVSGATVSDLCPSPPRRTTLVADTVRRAILRDYGVPDAPDGRYELDYLVTPELGGVARRNNLWPEQYGGEWNAHVKDQLERRLPDLVCSGEISLQAAQRDIATDWIEAYKKYFHTSRPIEERASRSNADADDIVFVPDWRVSEPRASLETVLVSFSPRTTGRNRP